jgi:FK506-binding nuclear protein
VHRQVKGVEFAEKAEDRVEVEQVKPPKDASSAPAKRGDTVHVSCARRAAAALLLQHIRKHAADTLRSAHRVGWALLRLADCGKLLDGTQFDAADEFSFELGAGEVIKGWDKGCAGLRVGEAVKLTVPSKLGYGKRGSPPEIPPDATLVFDIVMKRIR